MPGRKPDTVLSWPVARELATQAKVDPRTIHAAAKGEKGHGDGSRRARAVVAEYFEQHPDQKPEGWRRPAELPLPSAVAKELAAANEIDARTIQRAAAGMTVIGESGARALRAVAEYFKANPRGHVLAREAGEPAPLGTCEKCGQTNVAAGDPCSRDAVL